MQQENHVAEYVVLSLRPAMNRTEHLHFGIVVKAHDGWRVHLIENPAKLHAILPGIRAEVLAALHGQILDWLRDCATWEQARKALGLWGILCSEGRPGAFVYCDEAQYQHRVHLCMLSQVLPPEFDPAPEWAGMSLPGV